MPAQPKEILEKILGTLGFAATVEEHTLDGDLTLDVKTDEPAGSSAARARRSPTCNTS
jgi:hypothetical protein